MLGRTPYTSLAQIRVGIVDLAGVRIALYFPGDLEKADSLLSENFRVEKTKIYPDPERDRGKKRFDGYHARHYRVFLKIPGGADLSTRYGDARIETQLGSVLMHAWAEVEHDLIYKPDSGDLSEDEHAILDELNGLVLAGEIALERLQRAGERRISAGNSPFDNHFDLASFLYKEASLKPDGGPHMGRVDVLWELLNRAGLNTVEGVKPLLGAVDFDARADTIADQIADEVLAQRQDLYPEYVSLQMRLAIPSLYGSVRLSGGSLPGLIGEFLSRWILIERTFYILGRDRRALHRSAFRAMYGVAKAVGLPEEVTATLRRLQQIRNNLVHGIDIPGSDSLEQSIAELDSVIACLKTHPEDAVRSAYEEARRPMDPPPHDPDPISPVP